MATRRIRATVNNKYVQSLKLKTERKLVLTPAADYNSIVFTKTHRAFDPRSVKLKMWAKFNTQDFDGIHLIAGIYRDSEKGLNSASCLFKVYYVDANQNWGRTLVFSGNAVFQNGQWILPVTQANLGSLTELDGERTFMIEAEITRQKKTYKNRIYVNHLGVYDSIVRLRSDVQFLDLNKLDE